MLKNGSSASIMLQTPEGLTSPSSRIISVNNDGPSTPPTRVPRHRRTSSGKTTSPLPRRNSLLSDLSLDEARASFKARTDEVLVPTSANSATWHSIPLAFAVAPAIAGAFFQKGEVFTTDALLLMLAGIFLHWLVKFPWEWYQNSTVSRQERDVSDILRDTRDPLADELSNIRSAHEEKLRKKAYEELSQNEFQALLACFIGPLIGGYMLHMIRASLSRPSEGLVSNFNLTIFVLAAELRPSAQVVKLIRGRNEHLQSLVTHPPASKMEILAAKVEELHAEVRELSALATKAIERDAEVDALNRAVRRYEKKEALHSALTETRIHEIDSKLNDVVSLAAAATARQNQQTFSMILFEWCCAVIVLPFAVAWKVVSLPAKAVENLTSFKTPLLLKHNVPRKTQRDKPKRAAIKARSHNFLE